LPLGEGGVCEFKKMAKQRVIMTGIFLWVWLAVLAGAAITGDLPPGFVYVQGMIPTIKLEMRYCTKHNFVGRPLDGYLRPKAILTREAALALRQVQKELQPFGLGLKIFDAYRPQRAVDDFSRWSQDIADAKMKQEFYPRLSKEKLFQDGYILKKSSHSRGSTVDLTIISLGDGRELDMGSGFDFFGKESWPDYPDISPSQRAHRLLLQVLMKKHGFTPYFAEWWHFTLKNEPFPRTYFDFPVQ
jgi:D-alanyl-D-alanine dipeptidase